MKGLPRVSFWLLAITAVALSFVSPQSYAITSANPKSEIQNLKSNWLSAVQADIRQSEYHVTWQAETYLPDRSAAYQAPNRAHNLRTYFTPEGIVVMPRTGGITNGANGANEANFVLSWSLVGASPAAEPVVSGNRIEYQRGDVTEWYVNDESGLEQGVTLERPPAADGRPLVVELALSGEARPEVVEGGRAVEFTTADGQRVLRYGDLVAADAAGRELAISVGARQAGEEVLVALGVVSRLPRPDLTLTVETAAATYPITINVRLTSLPGNYPPAGSDGLSQEPDWTVESNQVSAWLGYSVGTAGDVNGDGYDDVVVGAHQYDNGQTDEGRVYAYYGSSSGLNTTAN